MTKKEIEQWIIVLNDLLILTENELSMQEDFNSYTSSKISNLQSELNANEAALNKTSNDPTQQATIKHNFVNSLNDLSRRINELRYKPMPPFQIEKEFRHFHQTNFNFIKPIMAQVPFSYSITPDPQNIYGKIHRTWAIKNVSELNEFLNLINDKFERDIKQLDMTEIEGVSPVYFVIHSN